MSDLGAEPGEVLFIDDRAENTRTARELGMRTITFTSASDLDRELRAAAPRAARLTVRCRAHGKASRSRQHQLRELR